MGKIIENKVENSVELYNGFYETDKELDSKYKFLNFYFNNEFFEKIGNKNTAILLTDLKELLPHIIEKEYHINKNLIEILFVSNKESTNIIPVLKNYKNEKIGIIIKEDRINIQNFFLLKNIKDKKITENNKILNDQVFKIYDDIWCFKDSNYLRFLLKDENL